MKNLDVPNKSSMLVGTLGLLAIVLAGVYGATTHADRLSALDTQTSHIDKVLSVPGNVSVCQYVERFVALYTGTVEARQRSVKNYPVVERGMAGKRDANSDDRLVDVDKQLHQLSQLRCQDIRTLVLDRQDEPAPIPSLP